jgi:hypothetical protein
VGTPYLAQAFDDETRETLELLKDGAWVIAYATDTPLDEPLKEVSTEYADDERSRLMNACADIVGHGFNQDWDEARQVATWKEVQPGLSRPSAVPVLQAP